jgi:Skp family chaperone for outer membrane proteins
VINIKRDAMRAFLCLTLGTFPLVAHAQSPGGTGWFVPDTAKQGARPAATAPTPAPRPDAGAPIGSQAGAGEGLVPTEPQGPLPPLQVQLPPMPAIPQIPKGSATPAAIVGILSVPDVLRVSTAYQAADKELSVRRSRETEDAQKEQNTLRELGQSFANERAKLTPEQIRAREKEYADRVNDSRRRFSERTRIIQEAGQYVMGQIERVIEVVAQQVAASRGVNLVLNRAQVLGTTADFDLTPQVAEILNKVLPTVVIPPDGISPNRLNVSAAGPRAAPAPDATPPAPVAVGPATVGPVAGPLAGPLAPKKN